MLDTPVKQKITAVLGRRWTQSDVARRAGVYRVGATRELICTGDHECTARHTPQIQEAIAKAVGIPTGKLFGAHAWFRLAARKLREIKSLNSCGAALKRARKSA